MIWEIKMKENNETKMHGSDGPTAVFFSDRSGRRLTLKQRLSKLVDCKRRAYIEKHMKVDAHSLAQVCDYIVNRLGYKEVSKDDCKYQENYKELRASYIIQYKPELLGELAELPELTEHTEEAVDEYLEQIKLRQKAAEEVPVEAFDIDLNVYEKISGNNELHFIIERTHSYISGGASGNAKTVKQHHKEYKQVYRYYGVTQEDIDKKTERFRDAVRVLAMQV